MDYLEPCGEYLDLESPVITFTDGLVVKVGDVVANEFVGLAVVRGPEYSRYSNILWYAEAMFDPGHC